jgi:hypothetical protein
MMITLEQLIQFFGATVLLTFSFTDKDGDGLHEHCLCSASLQYNWLTEILANCCVDDSGNGIIWRRTMRSKTNPGDALALLDHLIDDGIIEILKE